MDSASLSTPLRVQLDRDTDTPRRSEPVTAGVPLPRGACHDVERIRVHGAGGAPVPLQTRVLERWPDGSARWVLLDLQANCPDEYTLEVADAVSTPSQPDRLVVTLQEQTVRVATGTIDLVVDGQGLVRTGSTPRDEPVTAAIEVTNAAGQMVPVRFSQPEIETDGPVKATVRLVGTVDLEPGSQLKVIARLHFFARSSVVKAEITIRNERPASHAGGFWELGDPGSVYFRDCSLRIRAEGLPSTAHCAGVEDDPLEVSVPFELYQESSGGENWQSPNHVNREGKVPLRFRGYRLRSGESERRGDRATPVVWFDRASGSTMAVTTPRFWQNFPKAIEADASGLTLRLFPRQFDDLHELQGGEQKTHVVGIGFGSDRVGNQPLDWIRSPMRLTATPEWYARCQAIPYLTPASADPNTDYLALLNSAIEGPACFEAKREIIDEYGWRNFGDLYADHEEAYYRGPKPVVSHYNNQYDAVWGFGCQYLRSGDHRWWSAMHDLAAHVRDIDIYHTSGDKAAYSGGLFWHTAHYVEAGKSTHRSYPRVAGVSGGGPSNEQAYATGLMLHFFLTGEEASRDAALRLAEWVVAMDDGQRTPFRWLARGATGLASSTASPGYHGPGRGAGHAIGVLLAAFRLTGERKYLEKVEALIRRCIHPHDDVASLQLLDAERRWSYTVFLQMLGRYLDDKIVRGELDCAYAYARASLVHYARWMALHERPYLDNPDALEYPTETWAAQDMRKSDVLKFAARHAETLEVRARFLEKSESFFRSCVQTLAAMPTRTYTRPLVILSTCGFMHAWFQLEGQALAPAPTGPCDFGRGTRFVPQRTLALRRAIAIAAAGALVAGVAIWRLLAP